MRGFLLGAAILATGAIAAVSAQQPIELDRTLQRVYDAAIMASDVREARLLKLVPEAAAGDDAVQRALENRLLILHEMARLQPIDPGRDLVAGRKQQWEASWPPADLAAIKKKCGTTEQALDAWFRSDLQMTAFLNERFGQPGDPAREAKINGWIADLRKRANLK